MPKTMTSLIAAAQRELATMDKRIQLSTARQRRAVYIQSTSGSGDIDHDFGLGTDFSLVFIRAHFFGTVSAATMTISIDSRLGVEHDLVLEAKSAGVNQDLNLTDFDASADAPSPYTFAEGDRIRIAWTNPHPGAVKWGVELGFALAEPPVKSP